MQSDGLANSAGFGEDRGPGAMAASMAAAMVRSSRAHSAKSSAVAWHHRSAMAPVTPWIRRCQSTRLTMPGPQPPTGVAL